MEARHQIPAEKREGIISTRCEEPLQRMPAESKGGMDHVNIKWAENIFPSFYPDPLPQAAAGKDSDSPESERLEFKSY